MQIFEKMCLFKQSDLMSSDVTIQFQTKMKILNQNDKEKETSDL